MGKGSRPRPFEVDPNQFASNWELAFGKKEKKTEETDKKDIKEEPEKEQSENDK